MKKIKVYESDALRQVARFMSLAARTAPKTKGIDNIVCLIIEHEKEKNLLIKKMLEISKREDKPGFLRDAENLKRAPVLVIIGTKTQPIGLTYCSFCGYKDCARLIKAKGICAYNSLNLGIAVCSAVSIANNFHVDNRIMYSIGKTALLLNLFKNRNVKMALGIPLSATEKNIFFDRK